MKPLAYGYLQVDPEIPDNRIRQVELLLKDYAEAEGYRHGRFKIDPGGEQALSAQW